MANQYDRWFVQNDPHKKRKSTEAYHRSFGERYQRPSEYTPSVDEYSHYPAMKDIVAEQEEKKKQLQDGTTKQSKKQSNSAHNVTKNVGNIVKNVIGKAVGVLCGGAIVVAGYQAIVAEQAAAQISIVEVVADWDGWDVNDTTIMLQLKDSKGNVVKEVPADIVLTEDVAPTCKKNGSKTYVATAKDNGKEYSDTYVKDVEPLGHTTDNGTPGIDEHGNPVMVYTCSECDEVIKVPISAEEIDY